MCRTRQHHTHCRRVPRRRAAFEPGPRAEAAQALSGRLLSEAFVTPNAAVGRIWLYLNGKLVPLCSGTLNRRGMVLTAAHCLYDNTGRELGQPGYFSAIASIVFTPGSDYQSDGGSPGDSSSVPYGAWIADNNWVPECWKSGDGHCDVGLVELARINGAFPGDTTGTYPAYADSSIGVGAELIHIGYPGDNPFGLPQYGYGNRQFSCDTAWGGDHLQGVNPAAPGYERLAGTGYYLTLPCNTAGGASGGPWFANINGRWQQVGVENIGAGAQDQPDANESFQWFDDYTYAFYCSVVPCSSALKRSGAVRRAAAIRSRATSKVPTGLSRILVRRFHLNPDGSARRP